MNPFGGEAEATIARLCRRIHKTRLRSLRAAAVSKLSRDQPIAGREISKLAPEPPVSKSLIVPP